MAQGGYNYGYGNVIQIDHGNGYSTIYAHLSAIFVSVCQSVGAGQQIGTSGATGNAEGATYTLKFVKMVVLSIPGLYYPKLISPDRLPAEICQGYSSMNQTELKKGSLKIAIRGGEVF